MENRFYGLESRVYMAENEAERAQDVQLDDDTLMKQIRQDIRTKDILSLREHCSRCLLYTSGQDNQRYGWRIIFAGICCLWT